MSITNSYYLQQNRAKSRVFVVWGTICIILMLGLSASCKKNTEQLRIGIIKPSIDHLPLTYTINKNSADINNYRVVSFNSGWEAQEALIGKEIDVAILPFTYAWNAASKGYPIQIASFFERQSDGIVAQPEIKTIDDLNHKKVGVLKASTIDILMQDFNAKHHLDITTVYFRTPNEQIAALQSNAVDAIVSYVPTIQKLSKYHVLHWFGSEYPMHPCCDLVVNRETLSKQRTKYLVKLCIAMNKELPKIHSFDESIVDIIKKDYKLNREQAASALEHTGFMMGLEQSGKDFETQMVDIAIKSGYMDKLPAGTDIYWDIMYLYAD